MRLLLLVKAQMSFMGIKRFNSNMADWCGRNSAGSLWSAQGPSSCFLNCRPGFNDGVSFLKSRRLAWIRLTWQIGVSPAVNPSSQPSAPSPSMVKCESRQSKLLDISTHVPVNGLQAHGNSSLSLRLKESALDLPSAKTALEKKKNCDDECSLVAYIMICADFIYDPLMSLWIFKSCLYTKFFVWFMYYDCLGVGEQSGVKWSINVHQESAPGEVPSPAKLQFQRISGVNTILEKPRTAIWLSVDLKININQKKHHHG